MIIYIFFLILSLLPLIEGDLIGSNLFFFFSFCLFLTIYFFRNYLRIKFRFEHRRVVTSLFLLFLIFALISTVLSPVWVRSLNKLLFYIAFLFYFIFSYMLARINKKTFKNLLTLSLIFPSIVLCFISFYLFLASKPPPFSTMNLIYANFGHSHIVDFLIFSFPLALTLFLREKGSWQKIFWGLVNFIFIISFLLSFSRGGLFILILILVLFELFIFKKPSNRKTLIFLRLTLFLILIFFLGLTFVGSNYFNETKEGLGWLKNAFREFPFQSRIEYWQQAFIAFWQRPLFGWGLDNFRYISLRYASQPSNWSWYAHNHFFQLFVETGFLGGLTFFLLIFYLLKTIVKNILLIQKKDNLNTSLAIGVLASTVHSFFDFDWQFTSVFLVFWVIIGYLLTAKDINIKEEFKEVISPVFLRPIFLFLGIVVFLGGFFAFESNLLMILANKNFSHADSLSKENMYKQAIKLWPLKIENYKLLKEFYREKNEKQKERDVLQALIKLEPIACENYVWMAELETDKQQKVNYYLKALEFSPLRIDLYFKIINFWPEEKELEELYSVLSKIEQIKGECCLLKGIGFDNEEKILKLLSKAVESDSFFNLNRDKQARIYFWQAILTTYEQDWQKDIILLEKAVSLDNKKEYKDLLHDLITMKSIEGEFNNGNFSVVKQLAKVFTNKQEYAFYEKFHIAQVYYFLGEINFWENNFKLSEDNLNRSKQINPWEEKPYLGLARLYKFRGEENELRKVLQSCVEVDQWKNECKKELEALN